IVRRFVVPPLGGKASICIHAAEFPGTQPIAADASHRPVGFRNKAQGWREAPTLRADRKREQHQRCCGDGSEPGLKYRHNRVAVADLLHITQGSSFLATLGWRTQTFWD